MPLALYLLILGLAWSFAARARRFRRLPLLALASISLVAAADPPPPDARPPGAAGYHTVGGSTAGGSYMEVCGGVHQYGSGALHYAWTDPLGPHSSVGFSIDAGGGVDRELGSAEDITPFFVLRPAARADSRWLGGGLGVAVGALARNGAYTDTFATQSRMPLGLLPLAQLRIGPRDLFFIEGRFMDARPSPLPNPIVTAALGFPINSLHNGYEATTIRLGVGSAGFLVAPTLVFGDGWALDLSGAVGDEHTYDLSIGLRKHLATRP